MCLWVAERDGADGCIGAGLLQAICVRDSEYHTSYWSNSSLEMGHTLDICTY